MSDLVLRPSNDEKATTGTSVHAHQLRWMSHWMKSSSDPTSPVNNSSLIPFNAGHVKSKELFGADPISDEKCFLSGEEVTKDAKNLAFGMTSVMEKTVSFQNKISNSPFRTFSICENTQNISGLRTQTDPENMSLPLAVDEEENVQDFNFIDENNRRKEKHVISNSYEQQKAIVVSRSGAFNETGLTSIHDQCNHAEAPSSIVVFERHFSKDNFTCWGKGRCKHQNFSTILVREKKMNDKHSHELWPGGGHDMQDVPSDNKNFPFFLKQQPECIQSHSLIELFPCKQILSDINQQKLYHECQPLEKVPCSGCNVDTMRICTMVDSVENSPGGPPKISQRAHQFSVSKETCVDLTEGCEESREPSFTAYCKEKTFGGSFNLSPDIGSSHRQGVRIQPLRTSDSDEGEIIGYPLTCQEDSRNEASVEAEVMKIDAVKSQHLLAGLPLTPLYKDGVMDENIPSADSGPSEEKARSKSLVAKIPDADEEFQGLQPAGSSTNSMEPSTLKFRRLDPRQLVPCGKQTSRSEFNVCPDSLPGFEASSRWIKRLKLNSTDSIGISTKNSGMGEGSSHKRFNMFDKITQCDKASLDPSEEQMMLSQNMELLGNTDSSLMDLEKRKQVILGGSWIKRWCQRSTVPYLRNPEPAVICEPPSLKLGLDEDSKKLFPSIPAMALMVKSVNGVHPCEFINRGSTVVWNA